MNKQKLLMEYLISSFASEMEASRLSTPAFPLEICPQAIWQHKVLCVLSSQFSAQRAAVISDRIVREIPFFDLSLNFCKIEEACFHFLSSPRIGYRFPKARARQISLCWFPFAQIKDVYHEYVRSFNSEEEARNAIVDVFPGIGLKQASMFLRNIGASKSLSVIDAHTLFYLRICHNWTKSLTPSRYLEAEDIFRQDASLYRLDLNIFDTIVWTAAKALKRATYV
jgi:N-glycosylase/DNA lyase